MEWISGTSTNADWTSSRGSVTKELTGSGVDAFCSATTQRPELARATLNEPAWRHARWSGEPAPATRRLTSDHARPTAPSGRNIQAIREWPVSDPQAGRGWLGALQDPELGPALAAIHGQPGHAWTVASLAQEAAMSRSAFAARLATALGQTPADYVRQWKMHLAANWLQRGEATVAQAGRRPGYESDATFSRAYKRVMGHAPKEAKRSNGG